MINNHNPVLITGATGFIGSHLARKLLSKGYPVHCFIRKNANTWRISDILSSIIRHEVDLTKYTTVKKLVKKIQPKYIFHLATYPDYRTSAKLKNPIHTNIIGTLNLLQTTQDVDYSIFINTGSSSEYGLKQVPMKEIDLLEPISFYAATKASATFLAQVYARVFNKPIITFRPFSVYGPYEEQNRFIPSAIRAALQKKPLPLTNGIVKRDFIYIDDVVDAYLKVLNNKPPNGEIFNIGTRHQYENKEIIHIIESILQKPIQTLEGKFPNRAWDTYNWVADNTKTATILKWKPKYTLQTGLEKTILWTKSNLHDKKNHTVS